MLTSHALPGGRFLSLEISLFPGSIHCQHPKAQGRRLNAIKILRHSEAQRKGTLEVQIINLQGKSKIWGVEGWTHV